MSDVDSIVGEIDRIMMEADKAVVVNDAALEAPDEGPTMEEVAATVAGVVMEEFPAGGTAQAFGLALVEAAVGASEDTDMEAGEILAGLVSFFQEGLEAAAILAESYDDVGNPLSEEEVDDEDSDSPDEDDEIEDEDDDDDLDEAFDGDFIDSFYEG